MVVGVRGKHWLLSFEHQLLPPLVTEMRHGDDHTASSSDGVHQVVVHYFVCPLREATRLGFCSHMYLPDDIQSFDLEAGITLSPTGISPDQTSF